MQVGDTVRIVRDNPSKPARIGIVIKRWVSVGRLYARVALTDGQIAVYTGRRLEVICK